MGESPFESHWTNGANPSAISAISVVTQTPVPNAVQNVHLSSASQPWASVNIKHSFRSSGLGCCLIGLSPPHWTRGASPEAMSAMSEVTQTLYPAVEHHEHLTSALQATSSTSIKHSCSSLGSICELLPRTCFTTGRGGTLSHWRYGPAMSLWSEFKHMAYVSSKVHQKQPLPSISAVPWQVFLASSGSVMSMTENKQVGSSGWRSVSISFEESHWTKGDKPSAIADTSVVTQSPYPNAVQKEHLSSALHPFSSVNTKHSCRSFGSGWATVKRCLATPDWAVAPRRAAFFDCALIGLLSDLRWFLLGPELLSQSKYSAAMVAWLEDKHRPKTPPAASHQTQAVPSIPSVESQSSLVADKHMGS